MSSLGAPSFSKHETRIEYLDRSTAARWPTALLVYCDTTQFQMWHRFQPRGRATAAVLDGKGSCARHSLHLERQ